MNGLTNFQARSALRETSPKWSYEDALLDTSVIERYKYRNFVIATVTGVVAAVATVALFVFSLAYFVIHPAVQKFKPEVIDPSLDGPIVGGILGSVFGGMVGLPGIGFGTWALVSHLLDKWTIEPLRVLKEKLPNDQHQISHEALISLMQKCDESTQMSFVHCMNSQQLKLIRSILSREHFLKLVQSVDKISHCKWAKVAHFEGLSTQDKVRAIREQTFLNRIIPEYANEIREIKYANRGERAIVIQALDSVLGYDREAKRDSLISKCKSEQESAAITECFEILKGEKDLPATRQRLSELAKIAKEYEICEMVSMIGNEMIESKHLTHVELIAWVADNIPNEAQYEFIRTKALLFGGFFGVNSTDDFKQLWPHVQNWQSLKQVCMVYFDRLRKSAAEFRYAYQIAEELKNHDLIKKCRNFLRGQPQEFRIQVRETYRFHENIPQQVMDLVQ